MSLRPVRFRFGQAMREHTQREEDQLWSRERRRCSPEFRDHLSHRIQDMASWGAIPNEVAERIVRHSRGATKALIALLERSDPHEDADGYAALTDAIAWIGGSLARRCLLRLLDKWGGHWTDNLVLNSLNQPYVRTSGEVERLFEVLHDKRFTAYGRSTAYEGLLDRIPERRRKPYMKRLLVSLRSPDVRGNAEIWKVVVKWRTDLPRLPECRPALEELFGPLPWNDPDPV